jgi:hypothetical protein
MFLFYTTRMIIMQVIAQILDRIPVRLVYQHAVALVPFEILARVIHRYLLSYRRLLLIIFVAMILRDSRLLRDVRSDGYDYSYMFDVR